MSFIDDIKAQAKSDKKRIVLPEYMDSFFRSIWTAERMKQL